MQTKITHLTSAHPRYDTRIFLKECISLASNKNFNVSLIVADNEGNEIKNGITIYDVGRLQGRVNRIFKTTKQVFQKAVELDSNIYHLHDPELIPIGLKLKKLEKKVIFDSHEDVPNIFISYKDKAMIWIILYMVLNVLKSSNLSDIRLLFAITALYILQSNRGVLR